MREVVNPDSNPTFIKLDSGALDQKNSHRYIELISYPNLLILAEKAQTKDVYLHFYSVNEEHQIKVTSELARKADCDQEITYEIHQSLNYVYVVVHRDSDSEIIAVNVSKREVMARGFISG